MERSTGETRSVVADASSLVSLPEDPPPSGRDVSSTGYKTGVVEAVSYLDWLLSSSDLFALHPEAIDDIRCSLMGESLAHHLAANDRYRAYAARSGFGPEQVEGIAGPDDLLRVPLLTTMVFKATTSRVATPTAEPATSTTSSGTQGTLSVVPRDDTTLMRFFASIAASSRELCGVESTRHVVLTLAPPFEQVDDVWLAYVMCGLGLSHRTTAYVDGGVLLLDRLLHDLGVLAKGDDPVALVGPPALLLDVVEGLGRERVPLPEGSLVLAVGGWKRRRGEAVGRATFDGRLAAALGLPVTAVRDVFNMVELNTVVVECAEKRKHLPPWLTAHAREPATLEPVPDGELGVLTFLDPTPTSFPGAILSDDLGRVWHRHACGCGITSDVVDIVRRVARTESRGCAMRVGPRSGARAGGRS